MSEDAALVPPSDMPGAHLAQPEEQGAGESIIKVIQRMFLKSFAWIGIYLLGYYDFSIAWLITPLFLTGTHTRAAQALLFSTVQYTRTQLFPCLLCSPPQPVEEGARRQAGGRAPRRPGQREGDDRVQDQGGGSAQLGLLSGQGEKWKAFFGS